MLTGKKNLILIISVLYLLDFIFVIIHLVFGHKTSLFNLGLESNLPTFYQFIKTALIALVFIKIAKAKNKKTLWSVFAGAFLILFALDEWFQIHEKITYITADIEIAGLLIENRYLWVLLYAPALIYVGLAVYKSIPNIARSRYAVAALVTLSLAVTLEIVEAIKFLQEYEIYRLIAEEGLEMFGISSLLVALIYEHKTSITRIKSTK